MMKDDPTKKRKEYEERDLVLSFFFSILAYPLFLYLLIWVQGHIHQGKGIDVQKAVSLSKQELELLKPKLIPPEAPKVEEKKPDLKKLAQKFQAKPERLAETKKEVLKMANPRKLEKNVAADTYKNAAIQNEKMVKDEKPREGLLALGWSKALPQSDQNSKSPDLISRSQTAAAVAPVEVEGFGLNKNSSSKDSTSTQGAQLFQISSISGSKYEGGLTEKVRGNTGLLFTPKRRELEVRGGIDPDLIKAIVEQHKIELRHCYEKYLMKNPTAEGEVLTEWVIEAEGKVQTLNLNSTIFAESEFLPCLDEKMKAWKFPKPEGGTSVGVKFPLRFSRADQAVSVREE